MAYEICNLLGRQKFICCNDPFGHGLPLETE
jgi:hypothetical protein